MRWYFHFWKQFHFEICCAVESIKFYSGEKKSLRWNFLALRVQKRNKFQFEINEKWAEIFYQSENKNNRTNFWTDHLTATKLLCKIFHVFMYGIKIWCAQLWNADMIALNEFIYTQIDVHWHWLWISFVFLLIFFLSLFPSIRLWCCN